MPALVLFVVVLPPVFKFKVIVLVAVPVFVTVVVEVDVSATAFVLVEPAPVELLDRVAVSAAKTKFGSIIKMGAINATATFCKYFSSVGSKR